MNKAAHSGFETQWRRHQKSKTGLLVLFDNPYRLINPRFRNKIAFQWDAYHPLVDHIPACTGWGVCLPGGCLPGGVCIGVCPGGGGGVCQGISARWCLPRGVCPGVSAQGVSSQGLCLPGGVCPRKVSAWG